MVRARKILEVGTLGGYSAICMARGMRPQDRLLTIENDPMCVAVARNNIRLAGLDHIVHVLPGEATELLNDLVRQRERFDLIFIDADKANYALYLSLAIDLAKIGTVIVVDNVIREGEVLNFSSKDEKVIGTQVLLERLAMDRSLLCSVVPFAGAKGYDGFAIAVVQ